jgi:hypothetical protein
MRTLSITESARLSNGTTSAFHIAPVTQEAIHRDPVLRGAALRGAIERRYGIVEVRKRLHQQKFRAVVIDAYQTRSSTGFVASRARRYPFPMTRRINPIAISSPRDGASSCSEARFS